MTLAQKTLSREEIIHELWRRGDLNYLLKGKQVDVDKAMDSALKKVNVIVNSRRFGKSYICCKRSIETCLNKKNAIVKYLCPEQVMVQRNINPIIQQILEDCPPELKPDWKENAKEWVFPHNNSKIQIAGSDKGHVEKLRGGYATLGIVDEAGFCSDLDYAIKSVLLPTTLTTKGKIILASTLNSKEPNHEFNTLYVAPLEATNELLKFTIYESPMVDQEDIATIIAEYPGGINDPAFRCEYLCELTVDPESMVIPEFSSEAEKRLVKDQKRPAFYDIYESMDVGFSDLTGVLFGYYNFDLAAIVIEDELVMNGPTLTTENLALKIREKEYSLYKDSNIFMRIADNNNLILVNDLMRLHGITFIPTAKDNKEAQINQLRVMINQNRLIINPRCKNLLYHVKFARWNNKRNDFLRMKDSSDGLLRGGHADLLDALIYLVRNVLFSKNPYPDDYHIMKGPNVFAGPNSMNDRNSKVKEFMCGIMGIKPRK